MDTPNMNLYVENPESLSKEEYQKLRAEGFNIEMKSNTLEYFLNTSAEAEVNRRICTELMLQWVSEYAYFTPDDNSYEHLFQHAENVYRRIHYDAHPELHKQLFIEYTLTDGLGVDAFLSLFTAYIWLELGEKDWKINMLLEEMRSTDWSNYISTSPLLPGKEKEKKENINTFFQKANQIAVYFQLKRDGKIDEAHECTNEHIAKSFRKERLSETVEKELAPIAEEALVGKQLTNRQLVILFNTILNVGLDSSQTNVSAVSRLISAVSGKSSDSIRQTIKRGIDFEREDVKKDAKKVADLLNDVNYSLAQRLRADLQPLPSDSKNTR